MKHEKIKRLKELITQHLERIHRPGMTYLVHYLHESDFFMAPASTKYQNVFEGGLAKHSWDTMWLFYQKARNIPLNVPDESITLCGLMHDLCKVNYYEKQTIVDAETTFWVTNDQLPLGHGGKSVMMLQDYINLSDQEKALIRWHMGSFESGGSHTDWYTMKAWRAACQKWPEVVAMHTADYEAATYYTTIDKWVMDVAPWPNSSRK